MPEPAREGAGLRTRLHPAMGRRSARRGVHQVPRLLMRLKAVELVIPRARVTPLRRKTITRSRVATVPSGRQPVSELPVEISTDVVAGPERRQLLRRVEGPRLNRGRTRSARRP